MVEVVPKGKSIRGHGVEFVPQYEDSAGNIWVRGICLYLGWPHLRMTQKRVLVGIQKESGRYEGWFATMPSDDEPLGRCSADRLLVALPLSVHAVQAVCFFF